jgi:hypothetical protein
MVTTIEFAGSIAKGMHTVRERSLFNKVLFTGNVLMLGENAPLTSESDPFMEEKIVPEIHPVIVWALRVIPKSVRADLIGEKGMHMLRPNIQAKDKIHQVVVVKAADLTGQTTTVPEALQAL